MTCLLIVDICKKVQDILIQHNLNKSQNRAPAKLNAVLESEFQRIVNLAAIISKDRTIIIYSLKN